MTLEEAKTLISLSMLPIDEESVKIAIELDKYISVFNPIKDVDTEGIDPFYNELNNVFREDSSSVSLAAEDIFINAPKSKDGFFCVPSIW